MNVIFLLVLADTLTYTFIPPTDAYWRLGLCECTVSCVQHAGAALSTAHTPDRRRQVHPGPSLLGSGGCHIWGNAVFWRREADRHIWGQQPTIAVMYLLILELLMWRLPMRVWASTSANREAAGWSCGWVLGSPWERVEEADEEVEELWTERLIQ